MKYFLLLTIIFLSGCSIFQKKTEFVPVYSEIPIVHPKEPDELHLVTPTVTAINKERLTSLLNTMSDNDIFYILSPQALQLLLNNDVSKLEYMQHESKRANFYKDYINEYNLRIREKNK